MLSRAGNDTLTSYEQCGKPYLAMVLTDLQLISEIDLHPPKPSHAMLSNAGREIVCNFSQ